MQRSDAAKDRDNGNTIFLAGGWENALGLHSSPDATSCGFDRAKSPTHAASGIFRVSSLGIGYQIVVTNRQSADLRLRVLRRT